MTVYVPTEDLESVRVLPWFFQKKNKQKTGICFFSVAEDTEKCSYWLASMVPDQRHHEDNSS